MPTKAPKTTSTAAKPKNPKAVIDTPVAEPVAKPVATNPEPSERQSQFATILIGLLIIAAGLLIYNYFQGSTAPKTTSEQASATTTPTPAAAASPAPKATPTPSTAAATKPTTNSTYVVKAGDSAWTIATKVYGNGFQYGQIVAANNLSHDAQGRPVVTAGQVLTIPNATIASATTPATSTSTTTNSSTTSKASTTHVIQHGESLWSIAESAYGKGSDWILIYNDPQNHLSLLPDGKPLIHAGNILYLPAAP